jgi:hypothetical protein
MVFSARDSFSSEQGLVGSESLSLLVGFRAVLSDKSQSILYLPVAALVLLLGLKVLITALMPHRGSHNQE